MARRKSSRITLSIRLDESLADQVRQFVKDQAGKPLYLDLSTFMEAAAESYLKVLQVKLGRMDEGSDGISHDNHRRITPSA